MTLNQRVMKDTAEIRPDDDAVAACAGIEGGLGRGTRNRDVVAARAELHRQAGEAKIGDPGGLVRHRAAATHAEAEDLVAAAAAENPGPGRGLAAVVDQKRVGAAAAAQQQETIDIVESGVRARDRRG